MQAECNESFRCDCWGFEVCSIDSCGKYVPTHGAVLSSDITFQCELDASGSKCRNPSDYMDNIEGAENARDSAVVFVDEAVVDEREVAIELAASMNYKMTALDAIRSLDRHNENITDGEINAVSEDAELVAVTVQEIMIDLAEVVQESKIAYDSMVETKIAMRAAKTAEEAAKVLEEEISGLEAQALASSVPCATCATLSVEVERLRTERRKRAKAAGASAKKARDARKKTRRGRRSAQEKQEAAAAAKENCVAKARQVITRLQADASAVPVPSVQPTPSSTGAPSTTATATDATTPMSSVEF